MKRINLNALWMFDAAARHGNFSRAAEELNLTQGAVAQQIRGLEAELGQSLFTRLPRGVALTEVGESYHKDIRNALSLITEATTHIAPKRRVTLSVTPSLATKWLVPRMANLTEQHPDIELQIIATEDRSDVLGTAVDIAIRQGSPLSDPRVREQIIAPMELCAVAAPGIAQPVSDIQDLATNPLIQDSHRFWSELLNEPPAKALNFNQTALAIEAAANGQGIAVSPRLLAQSDLRAGRVIELWAAQPDPGAGFFMLSDARQTQAAVTSVCTWLLSQAGDEAA